MPKVTVIVPNYKHDRFLERRIQSILDQTYQDFELILMDDASPDNSIEILTKYAKDRHVTKVLFNTVNSGSTFKQWNRGIRHAQGEYIWIAESDDYAEPMLLEKLVKKLDENPAIGVSYCQSIVVDENDVLAPAGQSNTEVIHHPRYQNDFVNNGKDECANYLILQNTLPNASAIVFRRALYEQVGGADEQMRLWGDYWLWIKLLMISDIAFTAEPLNYFRQHFNNVRSDAHKQSLVMQERLKVNRYVLERITVEPQVQETLFTYLINAWFAAIVLYRWSIGTNFAIYKDLKTIDRNLDARLFGRFTRSLRKKLGFRYAPV